MIRMRSLPVSDLGSAIKIQKIDALRVRPGLLTDEAVTAQNGPHHK